MVKSDLWMSDIPFYRKGDLKLLSQPEGNLPRAGRGYPDAAVRSGIRALELRLAELRSYPTANLHLCLGSSGGETWDSVGTL